MDIQDFCWKWFAQSGHPNAYMRYVQSSAFLQNEDALVERSQIENL